MYITLLKTIHSWRSDTYFLDLPTLLGVVERYMARDVLRRIQSICGHQDSEESSTKPTKLFQIDEEITNQLDSLLTRCSIRSRTSDLSLLLTEIVERSTGWTLSTISCPPTILFTADPSSMLLQNIRAQPLLIYSIYRIIFRRHTNFEILIFRDVT